MELYKGYPLTAKDTLEEMIEKGYLQLVQPIEDDVYRLDEPGVYCCHIGDKNHYHILSICNIKADQLEFRLSEKFPSPMMQLTADGEEDGWQPTGRPALAPENFRRDQRDMMLCIWPDEILEHFGGSQSPEHHQVLTQDQLMSRLHQMEASCPYMELHSLGKTKNLGFDIPMAIFSTGTEEDFHDKVTVWYQAQVHGNEPASCDGALEVMERMIGDPNYGSLLNQVNLIVIPRVNPESAYLYRRMTYDGIDLNRDHLAEDAWETMLLHRAFTKYQPQVVLDGHEFISYEMEETEEGVLTKRGWELMTSPATSLNVDRGIRQLSYNLCGEVFTQSRSAKLSINHFGTTAKNSVGRAWFGLQHCLAFLIETRGIGAGRYFYNRRVHSQVTAMTAYLHSVAEHAEEIKAVVSQARQTDRRKNLLVLQQEASGQIVTAYYGVDCRYTMEGQLAREGNDYMPLTDRILRERPIPDAYLIPSDVTHLEKILDVMTNAGICYEKLPAGTTLTVQQYENLGQRDDAETEDDILAAVGEPKEKTFDVEAYLFDTAQPGGMVLAMLMEPDVTDSAGTKGTFYQQGLLSCEEIFRVADWRK